jgi:hypothetical protein
VGDIKKKADLLRLVGFWYSRFFLVFPLLFDFNPDHLPPNRNLALNNNENRKEDKNKQGKQRSHGLKIRFTFL